jgi:hypothetical protein
VFAKINYHTDSKAITMYVITDDQLEITTFIPSDLLAVVVAAVASGPVPAPAVLLLAVLLTNDPEPPVVMEPLVSVEREAESVFKVEVEVAIPCQM